MKITDIRYFRLTGHGNLPFNPGKGLTDLDVYPEYARDTMREDTPETCNLVQAIYMEIVSDEGVTGIHGPLYPETISVIEFVYKKILIGMDPFAYNRIWDILYKSQRNGTVGLMLMAVSAIDNALWDLRGKYCGQPVCNLLGGPTRDAVTAYATCYPELDFDQMEKRAVALKNEGFTHQKWFFHYGPGAGREGLLKNIEMAHRLRSALGPDATLMFDGRRALDGNYAYELIKGIEDVQPHWLEEPLTSVKIPGYRELQKNTNIRIATGEHIFTRWHANAFIEERLVNVLQTDPEWCGGITELVKIVAMAEPHDIQVVPHGHLMAPALNVVMAMSPTVCPLAEYLPEHIARMQYFMKNPIRPVNGKLACPTLPGLGYIFDEDKIENKEWITPSC